MRIGIVNDVPMVVEILRRVIAQRHEHSLIWVAQNGAQAVEMCAWQLPDVVLMDLVMPNMDGVEATRRIMQATPCPILLVTADLGANTEMIYQALGHGALDAVKTPTINDKQQMDAQALLTRLEQIDAMQAKKSLQLNPTVSCAIARPDASTRLVAVGASAGGPAALATMLGGLPKDFPAAIVVVQHIDAAFATGMAEWLQQQCRLRVRVACENDIPEPGVVLMAGTDQHLRFKSRESLGYLAPSPKDVYHPSIDVFFQSVVRQWRGRAVGVLLTGMGRDGAIGLKEMHEHGSHTLVQDRESCTVYGMPKAAVALQAASEVLSITAIAPRLLTLFNNKEPDHG
ncbi:chemotaxis response regulator protein-glutamate methylesterase [uncultured Oxalicibacterium sp.]|uniref:chemotaxis response regulator protein-glutamate methylesterase n=1 Tax=uncultured Oxalicibacterium sp. TaxID=1168540 RepID=UPI0025F72D60|nr:chemotaxis response regulator protein-glutamate methylesterase [uncultured Oxalicibacterium sp.]